MTQQPVVTALTNTELERLIAVLQEINGTMASFADRLLQQLAIPPAVSD